MEKITCVFFIVFFCVVFCFGQSHKMIIPIKEAPETMDNSFEVLDFNDFNLYYRKKTIVFPFRNITDSSKAIISVDFHINKTTKYDYISIKSIKLKYFIGPEELSETDKLKIVNKTFNLFRKNLSYIKYSNNINPDRTYFLQIPIVLTRKKVERIR